ncbi:Glucose-6-phosphate exchanger SLC37A2 [Lamellibrachia satsuma]|nr:Glucose-6-phosphate exchanger SLC37A2 [Lamellibrachia satsuma]
MPRQAPDRSLSPPPGFCLLPSIETLPARRNTAYKLFILVFTFLAYTTFHLSRKPISVVKNVLHQNCSSTNPNCSSWVPFDQPNYSELLGSLDYAFLFAYAIGMFLSGHLAERLNLRYFLCGGMLLSGLFTALFGLARYWKIHSLSYFIVVQVFGGLVQSSGWPSVVTCVANWNGKGNRGVIMGIWNSHTSVGNILGSLISGAFVNDNWGLSFIVPGAIIAAMGILTFLFLVPKPEDVGCPNPNKITLPDIETPGSIQEKDSLDIKDEDSETTPILEGQHQEKPVTFMRALKIPGVIEFSLCLFFAKLVSYTFLFWLPSYIKSTSPHMHNMEQAADLSTFFDMGGIVGGVAAGVISDRTGGRASICLVMLFLAAPMMFVYQHFGHFSSSLNIGLLLSCGALVNGPYALITTAVSADLGTHPQLQGNALALATVTAIIDGTGSMGAALGPLLTGLITPYGWQNVFFMLIAADLCALLLLIRLVIREVLLWVRHSRR